MGVSLTAFLSTFSTFILVLVAASMLFILSKGADLLINEAVSLSHQWGVPKVIIGATIVSLGTTLPEVSVSVTAALNGNADLALGNGIGSIIVDTGLIIGLASLFGSLPVSKEIISRQGRIQIGAGLLLTVVSLPFLSSGLEGHISQGMGFFFLLLLILYIFMSIYWSRKENGFPAEKIIRAKEAPASSRLLKMAFGITLVVLSSKILIHAVEISATRVGIPQSIIAATLVAFGTSLPELTMAISSVRKGHGELALGNIVGADILNVLFVIGGSAAVTKGGLLVPANYYKLQFPALLIILILFRYFTKNSSGRLSKKEGSLLLLAYLIYFILNYI
ncbi:MAG: sodium:calcium antiporter [Bacillota bacterium]